MSIKEIINHPQASIVDVRSPLEFMMGHVKGSKNIPLHEVPKRIEELRSMSKPLVLCCASGNRSGQAAGFLQQQGFKEVYNAGGWREVQGAIK